LGTAGILLEIAVGVIGCITVITICLHVQRSRKPEIPVLALEASGEEEVKPKRNVSGLCNDEFGE